MAKRLFNVDGITAKIDERVFNDLTFIELQNAASKPLPDTKDENYASAAYEINKSALEMIDYVLGEEKEKVIKKIRKKNDGFCDAAYLGSWLRKVIEQSNVAKKS